MGDRVRPGELLVVLDARDLDASSSRSASAREEVRAAFPEADSGVAAARANLDLGQATFRRMSELYGKKSISDQEFEEASARLKTAQAAYEMARAKRVQLDAKLAQAEQEVRATEVTRSYAEIQAPFAGIVTAKSVDPGNLAVPGAPLLTIERDGYRLEAASRSYTVKIDLPAASGVRSGLFGRAAFQLGSRAVLAIPAGAVSERGQLQSVFVADSGAARTRLITLGERVKDQVEVLSGLSTGERIIFPVPQGLSDADRVEVRP